MQNRTFSAQDKQAIRQKIRQLRRALPQKTRQHAEKKLAKHAASLLRRGQNIAIYQAFGAEADLTPLLARAQRLACTVFLPLILPRTKKMAWAPMSTAGVAALLQKNKKLSAGKLKKHFKINRLNILEPKTRPQRSPRLDVVFLPLIAFDAQLTRLGQGGGFYDASLARRRWSALARPRLCGVAFALQEVAFLPRDAWDVPLDALCTEGGILKSARAKR